ncbi:MAG TPA: PilZ domain-containing protein [Terriglobia bacterium]|nr:PilZ domain-containing protein [Terriglobia bacterium]
MTKERRRVPRYSAHVKASVKLPGESPALAVMVEDLCVLGCLLEYAPTLEIHQECDFAMTWKGREFRTPAVVAWSGELDQVGLEFHNTDPANSQLLREFCADFLKKPPVRLPEGPE